MPVEVLEQLEVNHWVGPFDEAVSRQAMAALEADKILFAPRVRFALLDGEQRFLSADCLQPKSKNVSFRPVTGDLQGTQCKGADRNELLEMLRRFYRQSKAWINALCPDYGPQLTDGFTTFRPAGIAGRITSWRKDDTRLHVDAFPSRPLQGRRILRVFTNVNPNAPRVWRIGEKFEQVASTFLPSIRPPLPGSAWLRQCAGLVKGRRTLYDHFMLGLHDRMKADEQYQSRAVQKELPLPPGSTWACFTDSVSHAAISGQFAFEQTFYLPVDGMREPARSPLRVLERLTGRRLV